VALQDPAYRADVEELLAVCAEQQVAVQTIKSVARRRWPTDHQGPRFSWYEPLPDDQALGRAVRWVLADPQVFLNTSSDARLLASILEVAATVPADPRPGDRPAGGEMLADIAALDVEPLFDGTDSLERI
jgi:hypothetical protein